jgi:serine acetyltransferase/glycosyltransferase involved in cell wall biosynthesis
MSEVHAHKIGLIAIGRNEGPRLQRCLESVLGRAAAIVYVDSGSTDASVALARSLGVEVVELDSSIPFSAARARNAGFERLVQVSPGLEYVQFVDGDCQVVAGWLELAAAELAARPDLAVVCGRRRERFPEASIYNRLCDIEWDTPVGEAQACGGDAMMRVSAFRAVGGFDPTVIAGEEPELCVRLRQRGGKIFRLDAEMTLHDAAMTRFGQWWKRAVRSGYGGLDVAYRFERGGDGIFAAQVRNARAWAIGWPLTVLVAAATGWLAAGFLGSAVAAAALLLVLPLQIMRLTLRATHRGFSFSAALVYGAITMLGKCPQIVGQWLWLRDRCAGRHARLIEYKAPNPAAFANGESNQAMRKCNSPFKADLCRYPRWPWFKEQSIWAIAVYRFGRWVDRLPARLIRMFLARFYWLAFRVVETLTGVSFTKAVEIGPGLRIWHFGNIFIHQDVKIGANCTLRQGVTIGNRVEGGPVPVVEDDVEFGAYAQVLGGVRIGRGARIGAMSVVLCDVPPGATAVGVPARIIRSKTAHEKPTAIGPDSPGG